MNPTSNHEVAASIPGLSQGVKDLVLPELHTSYGVGCQCVSDPALLWLWCRLAAIAPIRALA